MLSGIGGAPVVPGTMGTQGPALGIRSAVDTQVAPREAAPLFDIGTDGSMTFAVGVGIETAVTAHQATTEPMTPLKTMAAEDSLGTQVDVRA